MSDKKSQRPVGLFSPPFHVDVDLHKQADRLTERLLQFEAILAALVWKLEVDLEDTEHGRLSFRRSNGRWALMWRKWKEVDSSSSDYLSILMAPAGKKRVGHWQETLIKDASVAAKAKAAALLPELMNTMRAEFDSRALALNEGHAALDNLEAALKAQIQSHANSTNDGRNTDQSKGQQPSDRNLQKKLKEGA